MGRPPNGREMPAVGSIKPTRELSADERATWDSWFGVIVQTRGLLPTDAPLIMHLVEIANYRRLLKAALPQNPYENGKRHHALSDLFLLDRTEMATLRELGLTPTSFKNVRANSRATKEKDELDEFIE